MVFFLKFEEKIFIVNILSGLYFSGNILYLSHPSSNVHNHFLFSTSNNASKLIFIMICQSRKMFTGFMLKLYNDQHNAHILYWNCTMTNIMHTFYIETVQWPT
jgi:hypothetical protein